MTGHRLTMQITIVSTENNLNKSLNKLIDVNREAWGGYLSHPTLLSVRMAYNIYCLPLIILIIQQMI